MKTNIDSKKSGNFITMSWTPKNQLLLYINSFYNHSPQDILTFIDICADIAWMVFKTSREQPQENESAIKLESKISQIKIYIDKELKRMAEFLRTLGHDKTFLLETINKHNATYVYNVQQSKQALQGMLEIALGVQEESPICETPLEIIVEASDKKKRKGSKK